MKVKINNLSFKYSSNDKKYILDNLDLSFKENSTNVILGLNGCGKSTLLKILAGLNKPNVGEVKYDENLLSNISYKERSKIFSFVPQHEHIINDIPVIDYLLFGTSNTLKFYESPNKEELKKVKEFANNFNISHLLNKNMGEISGGERQLVLIACAIIQNTPIILLDEPTSALDIKNQNLVLNSLKNIAAEGKTIVLSTHNPNHALFLNSYVILIHNGKILLEGDAKEIITAENLKKVYGESVCYSKELEFDEISFK